MSAYTDAIERLRAARHREIDLRHELALVKTRIKVMDGEVMQDERHRAMHKIKFLTERLAEAQKAVADCEAELDLLPQ